MSSSLATAAGVATPVLSASVNPATLLSPLDISIIIASVALTLAIGWYAGLKRAGATAEIADYLVMGRRLTLPLFTMSLISTWYGGIFGVTAIAFDSGVFNFVTQGLFWYGTYIFFALVLVHRVARFKAITLPELVTQLYGRPAGRVSAVFGFFNMLPVAYSLSLGIFVQFLTGMALVPAIFLGTIIVIAYSAFGGMRSDVWTDGLQTILMFVSVGALVVYSVSTFGGVDWLRANLPETHFHPLGTVGLAQTLLWGFIALGTLVDPTFYQRCFAAKDPATARRGILLATFFWFIFDIMTTACGMYARAALPPGVSGNDSFLVYGLQVLPDGMRGLLIAGILATIMSTVDSFNFVAATTVNYDLIGQKSVFHRWRYALGVAICGLISAGLATTFDGSIKDVWKTFGAYWAGCLVVPVLAGLMRERAGEDGSRMASRVFIIASVTAAIGITIWRWMPRSGIWADVDDLYIGLILSSACVFLMRGRVNSVGSGL